MALGERIKSAFRWEAGAKLAGQLFTWAVTIIVIRLLSPEDYGLMAMAILFIEFLMLVNEMGLSAVLIHRSDLDRDTERQIFGLIIIVNILFFGLIFTTAPLVAAFFGEDQLALMIQVLAFQLIISVFEIMPISILARNLDFKQKSLVFLGASVVGSLATLYLAFSGYGVWALIWGNLLTISLQVIGLNIISPFLHSPRFSLRGMRHIITFGGLVTAERILWYVYTRADVFVVGKILGKNQLGVYSVAMHLASLAMHKTGAIVYQIAFPSFSRANEEPDKAAAYFLKAVRMMSLLSFPLFFGISSVAPEIVAVFLGSNWTAVGTVLAVLSLVMPFLMISNLLPPALQGLGHPKTSVTNLVLMAAVMPVAFIVGAHWGILGVSIAWVLVYPVVFCLVLTRSVGLLGVTMPQIFSCITIPLLLSIFMYVVVFMAKMVVGMNSEIADLVRLTILVLVGAAMFTTSVLLLHREGAKEVLQLIRR